MTPDMQAACSTAALDVIVVTAAVVGVICFCAGYGVATERAVRILRGLGRRPH